MNRVRIGAAQACEVCARALWLEVLRTPFLGARGGCTCCITPGKMDVADDVVVLVASDPYAVEVVVVSYSTMSTDGRKIGSFGAHCSSKCRC